MFEKLRLKYHIWKRYNYTVSELSRQSDRQLADVGIDREDIKDIARRSLG